jgi:predicted MPP superfamily phosphohydrolase
MKIKMLVIFYLLYSAANYYVAIRTIGSFTFLSTPLAATCFGLVMTFGIAAFPISRITNLPEKLSAICLWVGSYWFGILYYALILVLGCDILAFANRYLDFLPAFLQTHPNTVAALVLALLTAIIIYGTYNAWHPRICRYELDIAKTAGTLDSLHILWAADLHLGKIVNATRLKTFVTLLKQQAPDIILLAGDIIDRDAAEYENQKMPELFRQLTPRYGMYGVLGNHEYLSGQDREIVATLTDSGIQILQDQLLQIDQAFLLIGRDDRSRKSYKGDSRQSLATILRGADCSLPLILMDHQPSQLAEAQAAGIDLLLAGHTHRGQIFPNNLITAHAFEVDWGYLRKGALQIIVSCGYGTWGPPLRIGNHPEIVDLMIHFRPHNGEVEPAK